MNANRYMRDSLRTADRSNMDRLKLECALGLCGEAGEVAEQVKKHFFHGHELDKRHMIEELGDVAWYLAVLCDAIGSDLDTVMEENLKKLEQRYCNYGKGKFGEEITVIEPCFLEPGSRAYDYWRDACEGVEIRYFDMLAEGCTPQEARSVLPNSLKTEVVMTANIREWRHFLKLRCSPAAHPQMREVALILLDKVHWLIPVCFDDIWSEYHADV